MGKEEIVLKKLITKLQKKGFSGAKILAGFWFVGINFNQAALILAAEGYEVRGAAQNYASGIVGAITSNEPGGKDFSSFLVIGGIITTPQLTQIDVEVLNYVFSELFL